MMRVVKAQTTILRGPTKPTLTPWIRTQSSVACYNKSLGLHCCAATDDGRVQKGVPRAVCPDAQRKGLCEHASLVRRNVESGETLEFEETVIIMGDCRRGSSIISAGNVIVLGRLLGRVTAGANDDREAVVVAGEMQPHSVRIADVTLKPSYWQRTGYAFGQIAYVNHLRPPSGEDHMAAGGESHAAIVQELDKLLPARHSQDDAAPAASAQRSQQQEGEEEPRIKISPLARPYISFGPDIRQHPCAMNTRTEQMPAAAKSAIVTGCYASVLGFALMIAPVTLFSLLFNPDTVSRGFVRLGGALLALFGLYYIGATLGNFRGGGVAGFYAATVAGRLMLAVVCIWLFVAGEVGAGIMFFAGMNGIGALSMARALGKDNEPTSMTSYI